MSEEQNKEKRTLTDSESGLFKKQKLDDELAVPILSNTLVLDKTQEDTINQLVQSSGVLTGTFFFSFLSATLFPSLFG